MRFAGWKSGVRRKKIKWQAKLTKLRDDFSGNPATSFHATIGLLYQLEICDRMAFPSKLHTNYIFLSSSNKKLYVVKFST